MEEKTKKQKVKAWFKKYWWIPTSIGVGAITVIILRNKFSVELKVDELKIDELKVDNKAAQFVDEDIFTDLAIKIEEAVLDPDVEHTFITKTYDLDFGPKVVTVEIGN